MVYLFSSYWWLLFPIPALSSSGPGIGGWSTSAAAIIWIC